MEPGSAESVGVLLRKYRERAGLCQSALARLAHLDASFVNRVESGQRGAEREAVQAFIDALQLPPADADRLLAAGGHLPAMFARLGLHDPTLQLVAHILADERLSSAERDAFRQVVDLIGRRWRLERDGT